MQRYLMTHSLLSSWLYAMRENPYGDMTTEPEDPLEDFKLVLNRQPTPTNEAMQNGIDFEDMVTNILHGMYPPETDRWTAAAKEVACIIHPEALLQYKVSREIVVDGMALVLYGRLDALHAGTIYDIKFSKSYDRGKYFDSTQHPTYMELLPTAERFMYVVSNGSEVWTETYRHDETRSIIPVISDFLGWLNANDFIDTYKDKWKSQ